MKTGSITMRALSLGAVCGSLSGLLGVPLGGTACLAQSDAAPGTTTVDEAAAKAPGALALTAHVRGIVQDKQGKMWFATDGEGLCRWDGKGFTFFTEKNGLPSNYVRTVQTDGAGNLWITSRDGLCRFDGKKFTRMDALAKPATGENSFEAKPPGPDALFFPSTNGVFVQEGGTLRFFAIPIDAADAEKLKANPGLNPYDVYTVYRDREENIWMGTESRGVCKWDGKAFTWFREKDLDKAAVRAIHRDARGDAWFGNSGVGLFRYDGNELRNFGDDNNIGNRTWLQGSLIRMPGTIGDPHAIIEDKVGNVWIGAFDSGAWRYDGKTMTNFTTKDGLPTDSVSAIYEDRSGKLWIGTLKGVCTFDGKAFALVGEPSRPGKR